MPCPPAIAMKIPEIPMFEAMSQARSRSRFAMPPIQIENTSSAVPSMMCAMRSAAVPAVLQADPVSGSVSQNAFAMPSRNCASNEAIMIAPRVRNRVSLVKVPWGSWGVTLPLGWGTAIGVAIVARNENPRSPGNEDVMVSADPEPDEDLHLVTRGGCGELLAGVLSGVLACHHELGVHGAENHNLHRALVILGEVRRRALKVDLLVLERREIDSNGLCLHAHDDDVASLVDHCKGRLDRRLNGHASENRREHGTRLARM